MAILLTFDGTQYLVPVTGEVGWSTQATNLLVDLGNNAVDKNTTQSIGGLKTFTAVTTFSAGVSVTGLSSTGLLDQALALALTLTSANNVVVANGLTVTGTTTFTGAVTAGTLTAANGVFTNPLPVAQGGTGAGIAATARTNLGLGSAALLTAGVAAGNVVVLDGSAKLPAVDGSQLTNMPSFFASMIVAFGGAIAPTGWLLCDGASYTTAGQPTLFAAIAYAYGGSGANFNVPDYRSRTIIGVGTGTLAETTATVSTATDLFTVGSNVDRWITGQAVVYTAATPPTGLVSGTTYFILRNSATTFKLASTLALAVAGTGIDLTGSPAGNHTFTATLTPRALGDKGGEESHASTINETANHTHIATDAGHAHSDPCGAVYSQGVQGSGGGNITQPGGTGTGFASITNSTTGGGTPANQMMVYGTANWIIKT